MMIPVMVVLPVFFAFLIFLARTFSLHEGYIKATFLAGIFSPWSIFILNVSDHPVSEVVGGWERISGIEVAISGMNYHLILVELIVFSFVGMYSLSYFDVDNRKDAQITGNMIYPLILLLYGGIMGCFLTRDLFNFFVYMEIASISSIILVACSNEEGAKRASYRYLMLFFLSSFMFIFSIGIIYVKTGTLNFNLIQQNLVMSREIKVAIVIAFAAFITKAGIFPLHYWLPVAHSKADTPISALLSGLTVKVSVFGMILFTEFTSIAFLTTPLMVIAYSSILFGIAMAILQKNIKKILAYSTVSQMGFILLAIATLNTAAATYYAFAHALFKSALFLGVGVLITRYGTKDISDLSYKKDNLLMFSMIVLTLAIGGVSPLIGAFGKHQILSELSRFGVYLLYIGSIGTLTYFINLNYRLFDLKSLFRKQYFSMKGLITLIMAMLTVVFGVYYYPKLNPVDLVLIGGAFLTFFILKRLSLFEKALPRYFSDDMEGLGSEINFYVFVFVTVMITLLIYSLY